MARKWWDLPFRSCWVALEISTLHTSPNMEVSLAATKETENAKELEPSLFESSMLRKLTELIERIEQQNVEITNQQKELTLVFYKIEP